MDRYPHGHGRDRRHPCRTHLYRKPAISHETRIAVTDSLPARTAPGVWLQRTDSTGWRARGGTEAATAAADPLPSWNDGPARSSIVDFVARVTQEDGPDFVPPPERIATFDNDGTLWSEKPVPFQLLFALDRVKALAPQHPEWATREPFASVLKGDMAGLAAGGEKGVLAIITATHTGMTTDEFSASVSAWISTATHPGTGRLFTEMVYQPMLELLQYLRANGFKTFIVSGGGVEFMRPWTERVYGIPPEQVVGSSGKLKLETRNGAPVLVKLPEIDLIDDMEASPSACSGRPGVVRLPPSAIPTATCRCCSGPWPGPVRDWPCSSITTMRRGSRV